MLKKTCANGSQVLGSAVDREYKQREKPADALAKTSLSLDIARILRDDSAPEDKKVKLYLDTLRRYHTVRSEIPTEVKTESNPLPPSPPTRTIRLAKDSQ